jgi:hypothetical protein
MTEIASQSGANFSRGGRGERVHPFYNYKIYDSFCYENNNFLCKTKFHNFDIYPVIFSWPLLSFGVHSILYCRVYTLEKNKESAENVRI